MPRRYVIADLKQIDGPLGPAWVPATYDYPNVNTAVVQSDNDASGQPLLPWALVLVEGRLLAPMLLDSRIRALPDSPLDVRPSALAQTARNALQALIAQKGLSTVVGNVDSLDGFRLVVRRIGQHLRAEFHEDNFDVGGN